MLGWAIDLDGVLWRGGQVVPGAPEAVARLRQVGVRVAFVTNSSARTTSKVAERLALHGVPDAEPLVITSAMAVTSLVEPGERVLVVGSAGLAETLDRHGARLVTVGSADAVVVGISSDFDYDDLTRAMRAIRSGARFLATNDDATYPDSDGLLPGNGALVAAVAVATRTAPVVAGKPHEPIAALVRERLGPEGIMVGDQPETDGRFARALGYRFGLVLSGVTSASDLPVDPSPDIVGNDLAELVEAIRA